MFTGGDMKLLSHIEAEGIARAYLGDTLNSGGKIRVLDIADTDMMGRYFLGRHARADCWIAYVVDGKMSSCAAAPSRVICILKNTGEIVYDGNEDGA